MLFLKNLKNRKVKKIVICNSHESKIIRILAHLLQNDISHQADDD